MKGGGVGGGDHTHFEPSRTVNVQIWHRAGQNVLSACVELLRKLKKKQKKMILGGR